ncbi:DNA damage-regulated autophagy modulator protein 1 [Callorhinchus milii]|uniref:DNA damage regulated autophagy modulator 1 n=1 Tax=Callorhinchus milii TaxID=7868 RepID=A0A4W3IZS8_CALMI|nr:DNA damage-regulated autophagy modulator protein 1 [Callorhinchus milii]|eukprot:gi/632955644/ref/XP_007893564.1/ PREDICTED: DNA damage-regulated autophagy modulator protein 1 [Callorhinchus milii]
MLWCLVGTCYLPVGLFIWSCFAFIISYLIAVLTHHVAPLVPFISDTGTRIPERCVFGLMINISAFLGAATMYVRFKFLKALNKDSNLIITRLNNAGLGFGIIGCIGMCIVANFQETDMRIIHDIGAFLSFIMGTVHLVLQTVITCKMRPHCHSRLVCCFRLALSIISVASIIPMIVLYGLSYKTNATMKQGTKIHNFRTASAVFEWIVALSFNFFFLTYIREFQGFSFRMNAVLPQDD